MQLRVKIIYHVISSLPTSERERGNVAHTAVDRNVPCLKEYRSAPHEINDPRLRRRVHRHARAWIIPKDTCSEDQLAPQPELILFLALEDLKSERSGVQLTDEVDVDGSEVGWGYGLGEGVGDGASGAGCEPGEFGNAGVGEDCE